MDADVVSEAFRTLQDGLCQTFSSVGGEQAFYEDEWRYGKGEGGGRTRVWSEAAGDEKTAPRPSGKWIGDASRRGLWTRAACSFSDIQGADLPAAALQAKKLDTSQPIPFRATGVSVILHAANPWVPSVHANVRFFCRGDRWWFGGGIDMTPYYPIAEQVVKFHERIRDVYVEHGLEAEHPQHKAACDEYFYLPHRKETRGVGGVFFDELGPEMGFERVLKFIVALAETLHELVREIGGNQYFPFSEDMEQFMLYRRGRYVEFNLAYDRGTKFGLQSDGRTESILASLPEKVLFRYNWEPQPNTLEHFLYEHFLEPKDYFSVDIWNPMEYAKYLAKKTPQYLPTKVP